MSSRRARIKAVANLPVRRKNDTAKSVSQNSQSLGGASSQSSQSTTDTSETSQNSQVIETFSQSSICSTEISQNSALLQNSQSTLESQSCECGESSLTENNQLSNGTSQNSQSIESTQFDSRHSAFQSDSKCLTNTVQQPKLLSKLDIIENQDECKRNIIKAETQNDSSSILCSTSNVNNENGINDENTLLKRRRITKPILVNKRSQPEVQTNVTPSLGNKSIPYTSVNNNDIKFREYTDAEIIKSLENSCLVTKIEIVHNSLDIIPLNKLNNNSLPEKENHNTPVINDALLFNPPASPSKNRSRIRPTPRLGHRRNSVQGSASESEDDGRHNNAQNCHNRLQHISPATGSIQLSPTRIVKHKKRFRRTEHTKKLAEARKTFMCKFGSKTPDRSQLTVFDMIYYNPRSNPMKKSEDEVTADHSEVIIDTQREEHVDDPGIENTDTVVTDTTVKDTANTDTGSTETADKNDTSSESAVPVPQIKIGPSGEIILDEQSLVIETTGTKKGREDIAGSSVVYDNASTSYGMYKKRTRPKEWTVGETLRFYKTLNTVGTDFSIMLSLFPGRSRRDLKLKFKKEEKINAALVNKALQNPQDFDMTSLEEELQKEQYLKKKAESKSKKPKVKAAPQKGKKRRMSRLVKVLTSYSDDDIDVLENENLLREKSKNVENCEPLPSMENLTRSIDANKKKTTVGKGTPSTKTLKYPIDMSLIIPDIKSFYNPNKITRKFKTTDNKSSKDSPLDVIDVDEIDLKITNSSEIKHVNLKRSHDSIDASHIPSNKKLKTVKGSIKTSILELLAKDVIDISDNTNGMTNKRRSDSHNLSDIEDYIKESHQSYNITEINLNEDEQINSSLKSKDGSDVLSDLFVLDGLNLSYGEEAERLLNISELECDASKDISLLESNEITLPETAIHNTLLDDPVQHIVNTKYTDEDNIDSLTHDVISENMIDGDSDNIAINNSEQLAICSNNNESIPFSSLPVSVHDSVVYMNGTADVRKNICNFDTDRLSLISENLIIHNNIKLVDTAVNDIVVLPLDGNDLSYNSIICGTSHDLGEDAIDYNTVKFASASEKMSLNTLQLVTTSVNDIILLPVSTIEANTSVTCNTVACTSANKNVVCDSVKPSLVSENSLADGSFSLVNTASDTADSMIVVSSGNCSNSNICSSDPIISPSDVPGDEGTLPLKAPEDIVERPITNMQNDNLTTSSTQSRHDVENPLLNNSVLNSESVSNYVPEFSSATSVVDTTIISDKLSDTSTKVQSDNTFMDTSNSEMEHPALQDDTVQIGSYVVSAVPSAEDPNVKVYNILMKTIENGRTVMRKVDLSPETLEIVINNMIPLDENMSTEEDSDRLIIDTP